MLPFKLYLLSNNLWNQGDSTTNKGLLVMAMKFTNSRVVSFILEATTVTCKNKINVILEVVLFVFKTEIVLREEIREG